MAATISSPMTKFSSGRVFAGANAYNLVGVPMPYASGETPEVGDRISDQEGRVGTVTHINPGPRNPTELTIRWDDGTVGIRYPNLGDFTLISRAPKS
jgi:hypothetical protein